MNASRKFKVKSETAKNQKLTVPRKMAKRAVCNSS